MKHILGTDNVNVLLQWGSPEYHKQSLRNLQIATQKTKHLCAVILDTVGRELMIKRDYELDHEVCTIFMLLPFASCCDLHMYLCSGMYNIGLVTATLCFAEEPSEKRFLRRAGRLTRGC